VHFSELKLYCCRIALELSDDKEFYLLLKNKIASRKGAAA